MTRIWTTLTVAVMVGIASLASVSVAESATSTTDSFGLVDPSQGIWRLYVEGQQDTQFFFGNPGDFPFMGDWDCDGVDTPGLYRQSDGYVYLRNLNTQGEADVSFFFGNPGDIPIAGDFNANGCDTVSIYRPGEARFYIINALGTNDGGLGAADFSFLFGNPGDKPFIGDFNGNGQDTIGLHRESTGLVYFRNTNTQGTADNQFIFGDPGDRLIAGDWNGNGIDSPGVFRPSTTTTYLRYQNSQGNADESWNVGESSWLPVAGRFESAGGPGNEPPTITITSPLNPSSHKVTEYDTGLEDWGTDVTLLATAADPDGDDSAITVTWSSNLQGPLGTGNPIIVFLTTGKADTRTHTVTATATDEGGASTSVSVENVTVWIPSGFGS